MNLTPARWFLVLIVVFGCTKKPPAKPTFDWPGYTPAPMTTLRAILQSDTIEFACTVQDSQWFGDLERVLSRFSRPYGPLVRSEALDVTGDGKPDELTTRIDPSREFTFITHTVHSEGKVVWLDTMTVDERVLRQFQSIDSVVLEKYKHYLSFYWACRDSQSFAYIPGMHENVEPISLDMKTDSAFWRPYLERFRGRLIVGLDPVAPSTYIWDPRAGRFVRYYTP